MGAVAREADRVSGEVSRVMESLPCLADTGRSQRKAGLVTKTRYSQRTDLKEGSKSVGCQDGLHRARALHPLRLKKKQEGGRRSRARNGDVG